MARIIHHDNVPAHKSDRIDTPTRQTNFTWCDRCHGWYEPIGSDWPLAEKETPTPEVQDELERAFLRGEFYPDVVIG